MRPLLTLGWLTAVCFGIAAFAKEASYGDAPRALVLALVVLVLLVLRSDVTERGE